MKRPLLLIGVVIVTAAFAVYVLFRVGGLRTARLRTERAPAPSPNMLSATADSVAPQASEVPSAPGANLKAVDKANLDRILTAFNAPITFYGKVIDQFGQPVVGAKVHYSAADRYFGKSSKYEGSSDANGLFSISGIKGAGLYVNVYKEGYEGTKQSGAGFGYGVPSGTSPPSRSDPAIFTLRKRGGTEPLLVISSRQYEVPKNGTPVGVNLRTGRKALDADADINVQTWVNDQAKDEQKRFDWKCRISVSGGGLVERTDELTFEAPEQGYQKMDEIAASRLGARWKRDVPKDYFVKLADNTYALVKIELMVGGNYNFFVLESYLNPTPGDRNLEFDPAKEVKVK